MTKSSMLRVHDVLAITRLIGECRELGDDSRAWRLHLLTRLAELIGSEGGHTGEMAGCRSLTMKDLGAVFHLRDESRPPSRLDTQLSAMLQDPGQWPAQREYHRFNRDKDGACLTRKDFIDDRAWKSMADFRIPRELFGVDHRLWCFKPITGGGPDEHVGIILARDAGRRDFAARDRAVVHLAFELLAPLVGGPLARFAEPSPSDLPRRVREVLIALLDGDGDKQISARLSISLHTVNQYTKLIYRHFGVRSRPELIARWIQRGRSPLRSVAHARDEREG